MKDWDLVNLFQHCLGLYEREAEKCVDNMCIDDCIDWNEIPIVVDARGKLYILLSLLLLLLLLSHTILISYFM